jgi:DNA modification methylase
MTTETRWSYGTAGDRYPVQPGEIWTAGPHTLICADLEDIEPEQIARYGVPDLIYADLPYNAALASGYRTKAGMPRKVNYASFLYRVARLSLMCRGSTFIETGNASVAATRQVFENVGFALVGTWPITYYRTHPAALLRFIHAEDAPSPIGNASGLDDEDTPGWAMANASAHGDLVADWCTGRGLTPVAAHHHGRRFIGTELHPRRLAVTLEKLAALGATPVRTGTL